jgi:integrase
MVRLTVKKVEALRPTPDRREIPDGYVRGLYLVVQPVTGSKSWAVRYRYAGKTRKQTLGKYPVYGLKDARDAAVKVLRAVSEGRDPVQQRPGSVGGVVDQFLNERCKNYRPQWRREAERLFRVNVLSQWQGRKIAEIARADVKALLGDLAETPVVANRVHSILHTLFDWAVENDLIASSPIAGIKRPNKETPRDRVLTDAELKAVWQAADKEDFPYGTIIKLLILTGQRRGEVAGMAWSELDLKLNSNSRLWTLPRERVKNGRRHEVPLSHQALEIIRKSPRISEKYVFSLNGKNPVGGFSERKARLDQATALSTPWTVHDLRRTVASGLAKLGADLAVIEKVLNHVSGSFAGIVGVYQHHEFAEEKRAALQKWADHVEELVRP